MQRGMSWTWTSVNFSPSSACRKPSRNSASVFRSFCRGRTISRRLSIGEHCSGGRNRETGFRNRHTASRQQADRGAPARNQKNDSLSQGPTARDIEQRAHVSPSAVLRGEECDSCKSSRHLAVFPEQNNSRVKSADRRQSPAL